MVMGSENQTGGIRFYAGFRLFFYAFIVIFQVRYGGLPVGKIDGNPCAAQYVQHACDHVRSVLAHYTAVRSRRRTACGNSS
ncbi:hypothetical protein OBV_37890 [Oscillibacter valericigenes Sjm18-20]|nr:hypothetical protein OBV_37890 [Oscillibacter valericigenes Sjm18-20]